MGIDDLLEGQLPSILLGGVLLIGGVMYSTVAYHFFIRNQLKEAGIDDSAGLIKNVKRLEMSPFPDNESENYYHPSVASEKDKSITRILKEVASEIIERAKNTIEFPYYFVKACLNGWLGKPDNIRVFLLEDFFGNCVVSLQLIYPDISKQASYPMSGISRDSLIKCADYLRIKGYSISLYHKSLYKWALQ
jgi:hypothetical protein